MANTQPTTAAKPGQRPHYVLRWLATFFLGLIVLVGLGILIIWLVLKPKRLVFSVEEGSIQNFNISNDNHLNASFEFVVRSYNPNSRVSVYYDSVETRVEYDDQILAHDAVQPFFQPHQNVTRLELKLTAHSAALVDGSVSKDIRLEKSSGEIELSVLLKARIRFKVGAWKSTHWTLRIFCFPVVHFSKYKNFERTPCDVDLRL